jgi:hypothetical protein
MAHEGDDIRIDLLPDPRRRDELYACAAGMGGHVPYAAFPSSRLRLTAAERLAVAAFLRAHTDTERRPNARYVALQRKSASIR